MIPWGRTLTSKSKGNAAATPQGVAAFEWQIPASPCSFVNLLETTLRAIGSAGLQPASSLSPRLQAVAGDDAILSQELASARLLDQSIHPYAARP